MSASAALYAVATEAERAAAAEPHEPDPEARVGQCRRSCRRCRLDARASLYGRAGDAAKALEERP